MNTLKAQFQHKVLNDHFEADPHLEVQGLPIASIHVLHGETADNDILVVEYENSPALSFYNTRGRLIDVDHYLPDHYPEADQESTEQVLHNLRGVSKAQMETSDHFRPLLDQVFEAGDRSIAKGLQEKFGLETTLADELRFKAKFNFQGSSEDFKSVLAGEYESFGAFINDYLVSQLQTSNGYVHFTPNGNIIITTLNKRSGLAVIIETQDTDGLLLPPARWLISRTSNPKQLEQILVFRSDDIRAFFDADGYETTFRTDRYELNHGTGYLEMDSLLDNTNNRLKLDLVNDCYQILAGDPNIVVALTKPDEVTIINTHRSVVPGKWSEIVKLPTNASRVRADENLATLFAQDEEGEITVYDITSPEAEAIAELGQLAPGFQLDATGSVIGRQPVDQNLIKISTNASDLELPGEQQNFAAAFKNLSHLFKGENLFVKTSFARPAAEVLPEEETALPTAVEVARYDFETSIDHLLADAGQDFSRLLDVREKIAIARINIGEELTKVAEREDILLVGRRLQSTINNIVRPAERRVRKLVEATRAQQIIEEARGFKAVMVNLDDPAAYRDILNSIRASGEELETMTTGDVAGIITEFKEIQRELNATFSEQIAQDGNSLQAFITREIEQIEEAIANTHLARELENLLATHPAALELMSLLKQSFVLQSIAGEQRLSPAGIQSRLHGAVETRRRQLQQDQERTEAEVNAAKLQLARMIQESIDFFVRNHSGGFSDLELAKTAAYQEILKDTGRLENQFNDVRLAREMRQKLERRILERNRRDLERMVAFEGKYAFIQNDPDLFVDLESTIQDFPRWGLEVMEKKGQPDTYLATYVRDSDKEVYRPTSSENLRSGLAFEISGKQQRDFFGAYDAYSAKEHKLEFIDALWEVANGQKVPEDYPQFKPTSLKNMLPKGEAGQKALGCARKQKQLEDQERKRSRNVPRITPEFIDETPYFQEKLREFVIKAKLQLTTGSGIILLSGPPSTGKSAFLRFVSAVMNREYFEHASDKWQTKNSLVTAIKFGENGPYTTPAGFTKAITTPHSLINIEEIKEWPEALRKSLNPFFAGSDTFLAPDGTAYRIGDNILLCAAANLGAVYRQDDEPFTADFWSRIEVVEYNYAPHVIDRDYYEDLHHPVKNNLLTMQDLARDYFNYRSAPKDPVLRARQFARQFLEFMLLPKADERVKRDNLRHSIAAYFSADQAKDSQVYGPEEAAKVALRRLPAFQGYSAANFFDLYDHFVNDTALRSPRLAKLQTTDVGKYERLRVIILCLHAMEGCLRALREQFYSSAGQTEIEGTNREFINGAFLLGMVG